MRQVRPLPVTDQPQRFKSDPLARQRRKHGRQSALDDHQARTAIAEDVLELRASRSGIDRNSDRTQPAAAKNCEQQFRPVAAHDGDPVAGLDTCLRERAGITCGCGTCLGVSQGLAADGYQAAVTIPLRLTRQHLRQSAIKRSK